MSKDESQSVAVGMILKDIGVIKDDLRIILNNYVTRDEIDKKHHEIKREMQSIHRRVDSKLDKEDFKNFKAEVIRHIDGGSIKWGGVIQSVITTIISAAIMGGLAYTILNG